MDDDLAEAMALSMEPSMEDMISCWGLIKELICFIRSSSSSSTNLIDDDGWRYLRADKICEQLKNWIWQKILKIGNGNLR